MAQNETLQAISAIIDQLNVIADERIREAKNARLLLQALIKVGVSIRSKCRYRRHFLSSLQAIKVGRRDQIPLPVSRIFKRLCYYANARDPAIRCYTFRAVRHAMRDREDALLLCKEVREPKPFRAHTVT
jgi:hypothetical protein